MTRVRITGSDDDRRGSGAARLDVAADGTPECAPSASFTAASTTARETSILNRMAQFSGQSSSTFAALSDAHAWRS